jgi:hypothetical protein
MQILVQDIFPILLIFLQQNFARKSEGKTPRYRQEDSTKTDHTKKVVGECRLDITILE